MSARDVPPERVQTSGGIHRDGRERPVDRHLDGRLARLLGKAAAEEGAGALGPPVGTRFHVDDHRPVERYLRPRPDHRAMPTEWPHGQHDSGGRGELAREGACSKNDQARRDRSGTRLEAGDRAGLRDDPCRRRPRQEHGAAGPCEAISDLVRRHPAVVSPIRGRRHVRPEKAEPPACFVTAQRLRVLDTQAAVARHKALDDGRSVVGAGQEQPPVPAQPDVPPLQADALGKRAIELDARQDEGRVVGLVPLRAEARDRLGGRQPGELLAPFDDDDRKPRPGEEEGVARAGDPTADDDDVGGRRECA